MPRGLTVIFVTSTLYENFTSITYGTNSRNSLERVGETKHALHPSLVVCFQFFARKDAKAGITRKVDCLHFIHFYPLAFVLLNAFAFNTMMNSYLRQHTLPRFMPSDQFMFNLCLKDLYLMWTLGFPDVATAPA